MAATENLAFVQATKSQEKKEIFLKRMLPKQSKVLPLRYVENRNQFWPHMLFERAKSLLKNCYW